jgi:hypothetical protein
MPRRPIRSEASGFVLVGVVMFVLALVILGLSLFSLSSYEGQFVERDKSTDAAFYSASSGIEHAKFVLARRESLGLVSARLFPSPDVVYARAQRLDNGDTVGSIRDMPDGTPIEIRVMARVRNERRMIHARFIPVQTDNVYKRLITAVDGLHVASTLAADTTKLACGTLSVLGDILLTTPDASWNACAAVIPGSVRYDDAPVPDLATYWTRFWDLAVEVQSDPSGRLAFQGGANMPGGPSDIVFVKTTQDPNNDVYPGENASDFSESMVARSTPPRIHMEGDGPKTYIWMLDHGLRIAQRLDTDGPTRMDPGDCLVIVARHMNKPGYDHIGIWFSHTMGYNPDLPVILVSDAEVRYGSEVIDRTKSAVASLTLPYSPGTRGWLAQRT